MTPPPAQTIARPLPFVMSDEQEMLRDVVRRFLRDRCPPSVVRAAVAERASYDPRVWSGLVDMGLPALGIGGSDDGAGGSLVELAIVSEELGYSLAPSPFFASVLLACPVLGAVGGPLAARAMGRIAAGATAAVAVAERSARWTVPPRAMRASEHGEQWRLTGEKSFVVDGDSAEVLIVSADVDGACGLFLVQGDAAGLERTALASLDRTRPLARIVCDGVEAFALMAPCEEPSPLFDALDRILVCVAAEQAGGAQRVLELTVDYVQERRQFGVPVGSFQAVKHLCADMLMATEAARAAAGYAAWAEQGDPAEFPAAALVARCVCADAFVRVAELAIQAHGGIGYTWEHDAHLFLKRAKSSQLMFGDSGYFRDLLGDRLGY